ncbi:MAG: hypothetical protein JO129_00250 [Candidatus Dependentiae bacterium]|nr:hypothetical protein [Candidatus Dependentiae bacterium]
MIIIKNNKETYDFALLISGNRGGVRRRLRLIRTYGGVSMTKLLVKTCHKTLEIKKTKSNWTSEASWNHKNKITKQYLFNKFLYKITKPFLKSRLSEAALTPFPGSEMLMKEEG